MTGAGSVSADALPRSYDIYSNAGGTGGRIAIVVTEAETCGLSEAMLTAYGMWGVPAGARLVLPNGAASVSAASERLAGLVTLGGEIDFGVGDQTFRQNWIFQADTPYVFEGNVTVTEGAAIGCLPFAGGEALGENGGTIYVRNGGPCAAWTALPSRTAGG